MLVERIENRWLAAFTRTFTLCKVQPGEVVAILAETQSRRVNVDLARLALEAIGDFAKGGARSLGILRTHAKRGGAAYAAVEGGHQRAEAVRAARGQPVYASAPRV